MNVYIIMLAINMHLMVYMYVKIYIKNEWESKCNKNQYLLTNIRIYWWYKIMIIYNPLVHKIEGKKKYTQICIFKVAVMC